MTEQALEKRPLGQTGMLVTRMGYGAMSLDSGRFSPVSPEEAASVLTAVLDAGINFIDTSPDYGESEESVGRFIAHRRGEFYLATKCGCPVASSAGTQHVYTRENVVAAVEQSLQRMHTDHIDLIQFHGAPSPDVLEDEGAIETLRDLQSQGKVRFIGISSVLPGLARHITMGVFDAFQIPYSAPTYNAVAKLPTCNPKCRQIADIDI